MDGSLFGKLEEDKPKGEPETDEPSTDKPQFKSQVMSNLALKVNMKMGGENHWLNSDVWHEIFGSNSQKKSTIILGADVTHPPAGAKLGAPSIACVVGSVDFRFYELSRLHATTGGRPRGEHNPSTITSI